MKKLYIILIALLFIFGCKSKDKKYDDIEFISYMIRIESSNDTTGIPKYILNYRIYALINTEGKTKMVVQRFYPKYDINYYDFNIDKNYINNLVDSINRFKPDTTNKTDYCLIYDGPGLRIRINENDTNKSIHFIDHINGEYSYFVKFYRYLDSLAETKNLKPTNDTLNLIKRRNDFINWTFRMDTINSATPLKCVGTVKFVPVIIAPDDEVSDK